VLCRTYGENRFDFIHERQLIGSVSDHANFYKNVYSSLKPGGWFELVEMEAKSFSDDGTLKSDAALVRWGQWIEEAFGKIGRPFLPIERYKELMEDTGFVNVKLRMVKRPMNDWPKDPRQKEIGKVRARVRTKLESRLMIAATVLLS